MSELSLFPPDVEKSAVLSECGRYRYELRRIWGDRLPKRRLRFVMLNPSVADADIDDPTIRRCMGFGRSLGYDGIVVVNLFAWRATDPDDLLRAVRVSGASAIGPENDHYIDEAVIECSTTIAAWGSFPSQHRKRHPVIGKRVEDVVRRIGPLAIHALGTTQDGSPQHPLYLPGDRKPVRWWL